MKNVQIPEGKQELFDSLPEEYSHLYLAIENQLAGVICIEDTIEKRGEDSNCRAQENRIWKDCYDDR